MILFTSDYTEGCHPNILKRLSDINFDQNVGYGDDAICEEARRLILAECGRKPKEDLDVHFVVGGTQTNKLVISAALRPCFGVATPFTGHLNTHEAAAIESSGHKVMTIPTGDGKLTGEMVENFANSTLKAWDNEHIAIPGMVYISNSTEMGTVYTRAELSEIRKVCDKYELLLYLDGARMGYGLASDACDLDLKFIADTVDVFYIGGTKQGALMGEAIVIRNDAIKPHFRNMMKQHGAMLAKGWLLGVQFEELFKDGLYFRLAEHADKMSQKLRRGMEEMGIRFVVDGPTNMQYPILCNEVIEKITENFGITPNGPCGEGMSSIRLCTGWATKEENVDAFLKTLKELI